MCSLHDSLSALIESVRDGAAEMQRAVRCLELANKQGAGASEQDVAVVSRWLEDAARIAAHSCDEPNPLSKELGARLEESTARLRRKFRRRPH